MQRRFFLSAGSASLASLVTACGGGGGSSTNATDLAAAALTDEEARRRWGTPSPTPAPTPVPTPAPTAAPAPAPAPAASGSGYAFGSRKDLSNGRYPYGIQPNNFTNAQMDARVQACYDAWKSARLRQAGAFTASAGMYAGQTVSGAWYVSNGSGCFSEGNGYGMLITVVMAGYDASAKTYFDGLFKMVRGRPSYNMPTTANANRVLHEWKLDSGLNSAGGGWNASDGDLDVALALLMADRQWGSAGAINYKAEAVATINALKAVNFRSTGEQYMPQNVSRTSDYMIGHFRSFKAATGDSFWDLAVTRSASLVNTIISGYSPSAHLTPGFIYDPAGTPRPDTVAHVDGSGVEQLYDQNAVRNPWRWGTDYLWSGDTTWGGFAKNINTTIKADCGSDPNNTCYQYNLNGTGASSRYFSCTTVGGIMVGSMCDSTQQSWLNQLFSQGSTVGGGFSTTYYDSELILLPLIVASGNWWRP